MWEGIAWAGVVAAVLTTAASAGVVFPGPQWEFRTPQDSGLGANLLQQFGDTVGGRGCVVRYGYMVHTWGSQIQRSDISSAAKPIYTHFLFKAVEDGAIPSLDDLVVDFEPGLDTLNPDLGFKDRDITWRHMSNQVSCYGVVEHPGTAFDYSDWQMALFWDTLFLNVYGSTWATVDDDVFHPMLTDVLECEDNPTMMVFGTDNRPGRIGLSVRDFCRFGLLYLHGGNWNGVQLVSPTNAAMAVTSPLSNSIPRTTGTSAEMIPGQRSIGGGNNQTEHYGSYSFLWWINGVDGNGQRHLPDVPEDAYVAAGHGGRRLLVVIPSLGIVASWNDGPTGWTAVNDALAILVNAVLINDTTPPTVPGGLTAVVIDHIIVDLSWQAADDPETGITLYNVYRDGVGIDLAASTSYTDVGLAEQTTYTYRVSAVNGAGLEGAQSDPAQITTSTDSTPPAISSVQATLNPVEVTVRFNEPVEQSSAESAANYAVDHGVTVSAAVLDADTVTVTLSVSALTPDVLYRLGVDGVLDRSVAGNSVVPGTETVFWIRRVTAGLIALYDLEEGVGSTAYDISGQGTPLNLSVADVRAVSWIPGGLSIDSSTIVQPLGSSTKVSTACIAANEITIEAWMKPADTVQSGPARIVTLSEDPGNRNFTLGQSSDRYDVRLRTTTTSDNGEPALSTPAGDLTTDLAHVVYTRSPSGDARLYVNAVERATATIAGNFSNWNPTYTFALANEITMDRPWLGEIHLVALYDRALLPGEVQQNFAVGADPTPPITPGDIDADGDVDIGDFLALLAAWGPCPGPPADCPADLDDDGEVAIDDFLTLLANWG